MFRVIEALEDSDDVQNVFANGDVPDDVLAQLDEDEDWSARTPTGRTSGPAAPPGGTGSTPRGVA